MAEHEYNLLLKGKDNKYKASIDVFNSLNYSLLFNEVGSYSLAIPYNNAPASDIEQMGKVEIVRDDVIVFTGLIQRIQRKWNRNDNIISLSGADENYWLASRLALPVPLGDGNYSSQEHDVRTGAGETIIKQYVDYALASNALTARQVSGITIEADAGAGNSITGRARFQNLLLFLQELAIQAGDLGIEIANNSFNVYIPTDKSGNIVFSEELENLNSFEYNYRAPLFNYVICGGGGEGTARTFLEHGDSQSLVDYGRIEFFRDRRDTTDTTELYNTIDEELENNTEQFDFVFSAIEIKNMVFFDDYFLGDKIRCVVDGVKYDSVVRSANFRVLRDGEKLELGMGNPYFAGGEMELIKINKMLKRRLSNLERR